MPILAITETGLTQRCAKCSSSHELTFESLDASVESDQLSSGVFALPACTCGSSEFLIHSPKDESEYPAPGSFGHLHRLAVDALLDVLGERPNDTALTDSLLNRINTRLGSTVVAEYFPEGIKLDPQSSSSIEPPTPTETPSSTVKEEDLTSTHT
jgi:hypothetical protein